MLPTPTIADGEPTFHGDQNAKATQQDSGQCATQALEKSSIERSCSPFDSLTCLALYTEVKL